MRMVASYVPAGYSWAQNVNGAFSLVKSSPSVRTSSTAVVTADGLDSVCIEGR